MCSCSCRAHALLTTLNESLLKHDSATAVLQAWCDAQNGPSGNRVSSVPHWQARCGCSIAQDAVSVRKACAALAYSCHAGSPKRGQLTVCYVHDVCKRAFQTCYFGLLCVKLDPNSLRWPSM